MNRQDAKDAKKENLGRFDTRPYKGHAMFESKEKLDCALAQSGLIYVFSSNGGIETSSETIANFLTTFQIASMLDGK